MDILTTTESLIVFFDNILVKIIVIVLVLLIFQLVIRSLLERIVRRAVRSDKYQRTVDEVKREDTLITMFRTATALILWIFGVIFILWQLDVNLAALATGAGLIGIIIGFGAQSSIKDFLAGVFIILENQYRVGDIIKLRTEGGDISGLVEDITVRITRLRDLDGNLHIVPNGSISIVTNLSFHYANVNVDIGVAYESNIDHVEKTINKVGLAMAEDEKLKELIIEPIQFLRVDGFEDSAVRIKALGKVLPAEQWTVAGEFRRRLITAFEKEGITIPFPQVVVRKPTKA